MYLKPQVVNLKIPAGSSFDSKNLKIKKGKVVKCALFTDTIPSAGVHIKIETDGGDELHPLITYKEFLPTNGNHYDSRKNIDIPGNIDIKIIAQSVDDLAVPFNFQMIFYIED